MSSHPDFDQHENVAVHNDDCLQAIIAIHNTNLGPAAGGCRIYPYGSTHAAIADVLRLSRGMTYKSAMAGLPYGGGKSVIIADPATDKSPRLLTAMGDFIESLQGKYIAAEDSGTTVEDIKLMAKRTRYVSGYSAKEKNGGDPSPVTALGVFYGIEEAVKHQHGKSLKGMKVAVQGVGNVGINLVRLLKEAKAKVIVADANAARVAEVVRQFKVACCSTEKILSTEVDVLAPCALGGAINSETIASLQANIVAGAANNQLQSDELGALLMEKGILYAPDYVINCGGIMDIYHQQQGIRDSAEIKRKLEIIRENLSAIFEESNRSNRATNIVADELAREKFQSGKVHHVAA
ncbi:MAG: amino acid dehydrogenase [Pseudomonadales bacterium]|nr:amino acid dehydrogenase [Pseudomonadales bacterium]